MAENIVQLTILQPTDIFFFSPGDVYIASSGRAEECIANINTGMNQWQISMESKMLEELQERHKVPAPIVSSKKGETGLSVSPSLLSSLTSPSKLSAAYEASSVGLFAQTKTSNEKVTVISKSVENEVNAEEVKALLKWVTEGHLEQAEKLLDRNPKLALAQGDITDLSGRIFENITAFQLAVWYLDDEMWEIILRYLDKTHAKLQLEALENDRNDIYEKYGKHFNFQKMLDKYLEFFDRFYTWNNGERKMYWCKQIGGAQREWPAWIVYAFCERGLKVVWTQKNVALRVKRQYTDLYPVWLFNFINYGGLLGDKWAVSRGDNAWMGAHETININYFSIESLAGHDMYMFQLFSVKQQKLLANLQIDLDIQLSEKVMLGAKSIENNVSDEISALLKMVYESNLILAENMLQNNPKLALAKGSVTDLSGRTFENITPLQLAVWYLDSDMWEMLLKYLDKSEAANQFNILMHDRKDIHDKYGRHYNFDQLLLAYDTYLKNYHLWDLEQLRTCWRKQIGGAQSNVPAWYIKIFSEEGYQALWVQKNFTKLIVFRSAPSMLSSFFSMRMNEESNNLGCDFAWARGRMFQVLNCSEPAPRTPILTSSKNLPTALGGVSVVYDREVSEILKLRQQDQLDDLKTYLSSPDILEKPSSVMTFHS